MLLEEKPKTKTKTCHSSLFIYSFIHSENAMCARSSGTWEPVAYSELTAAAVSSVATKGITWPRPGQCSCVLGCGLLYLAPRPAETLLP